MATIAYLTASVTRKSGGLYTSVRSLAQSLQTRRDTQIYVLSIPDQHVSTDIPAWKPISPELFPSYGPWSFRYAPGIQQRLIQLDLDIVHTHHLWMYPSIATLQWARRTKKPYIVTPRGMIDPWALQNARWKKRLSGWLFENAHLKGAACLHALCESEAQSMRSYGLRNSICVIPNGIELPDKTVLPSPMWKSKMPKNANVLLYLGRLHPKKGLINLLHGWKLLSQRAGHSMEEWYIVIAGWDQDGHEDKLKTLAQELGIQDNIIFVGPQFGINKEACYYHANAFILPSLSEGLPMVVLEAWAYGLPVVMTPECHLPDGFKKKAALRIESDSDSIAHGLERLFFMSDAERKAMGWRGHQLVESRFTWSKIAEDMQAVYQWVLGGGIKPNCVITN